MGSQICLVARGLRGRGLLTEKWQLAVMFYFSLFGYCPPPNTCTDTPTSEDLIPIVTEFNQWSHVFWLWEILPEKEVNPAKLLCIVL